MSAPQSEAPRRVDIDFDAMRNAAVAALIVCIPFAIVVLLPIHIHSPDLERGLLKATTIGILDVVLFLLAVLSAPVVMRRRSYEGLPLGLIGLIALTVATAVWIVFMPSLEGTMRLIRLAGVSGAVAIMGTMGPTVFRNFVVWPLTISLLVQAPWAILQTHVWRNGHESGITERFDHVWTHGYGTMDGGYALAAFSILSVAIILGSGAFKRLHPVMWAAVILGSFSMSTSYGRLGVIGAVAIAVFYTIGAITKRRRDYAASAAVTVIPLFAGIAVTWTAWSVRATETAAGYQSGRESLFDQAFQLIGLHPWWGVGPARIGPALAEIGLTPAEGTYVHNIPVLIAVEYGVAVGIVAGVWLVAVGLTALFTSWRAAAIFAAIAPYLVFDHPHLVYVYGIASFGIALGALDFHRRHRSGSRDEDVVQGESAQEPVPA